jgi:general stress protein YciG
LSTAWEHWPPDGFPMLEQAASPEDEVNEEKVMSEDTGKSERGFASMDREKQREIASKGGHAAHKRGTAHEFTSEEARKAGHKGGETVSRDREHMSEIGRRGGEHRAKH